jgi:hypothetical protein
MIKSILLVIISSFLTSGVEVPPISRSLCMQALSVATPYPVKSDSVPHGELAVP